MRRIAARLFNGAIAVAGLTLGILLRKAIHAGWLYFPFVSEALAVVPFSLGWKLRRAVYAQILPRIGKDAVLHFGVVLEDPRCAIGDDVWISSGCYLDYTDIGD